ncbi:hypothetical protein [Streptomyces brasiliensis]|uniref:Uncharacterized protein n=1 Tax=Streptomyces brasiliensis TaxID=1954 RepID=A0A917P4K7_9ACTN|nr:hypothetical protein [Streptomyces brasiliensis]GGJ61135.1 hypothetical protein GCM10010121_084580 [Streptomyces brasiliensis]
MTAPHDASGVRTVIGVDAGTASLREADHLVHDLVARLGLPPGTLVCTHLVRAEDRRGTAVSLALPDAGTAEEAWRSITGPETPGLGAALGDLSYGPEPAARAAARAAAEHAGREAGRAVVFPGVEHLTGTVTVADVLALTAVEHLTVLGAPDVPDPATPVVTRDHVRPEWRGGRLTLALVPAAGGALAPFEVPNPTPCCADHA